MILLRHGQSEFNVSFSTTGRDPKIKDPVLTDLGREQARAAVQKLRAYGAKRIIVSPYKRTLQTCLEILSILDLPVTVDPMIRERGWFICDIGSPRSLLAAEWPEFDFTSLDETWWIEGEGNKQLITRCNQFHKQMQTVHDWKQVAVISHWGFIRGLTGQALENGQTVIHDVMQPMIDPPPPPPTLLPL